MTEADDFAAERLHTLLDTAAAAWPDAPAVRDAGGRWTFAGLAERSRAAAHWLARRGFRPGDRLLVATRPGREAAALLFGCSRARVVFVPVSPQARPAQWRNVLDDCVPRGVLTDEASTAVPLNNGGTVALGLERLREELDEEQAAATDPERAAPTGPGQAGPAVPERMGAGGAPRDPALLLYTSGTTAAPKGVVCPHSQVVFAARAIARTLAHRPDDVVFSALPLSFDYGLYQILLTVLAGAELVLATPGPDLLTRLRRSRATVVPVVPPLADALADLAERHPVPSTVRLFTNTGAHLPEATATRLRRAFPGARITLMYGCTECKRVSVGSPDGDLARPGSVGRPLPGTTVRILDEDGAPLPPWRTGQIVVAGPHVAAGYWRAPEETARRFRRDPATGDTWLYTGDHGYLDDDGFLYCRGRRDEIFKLHGVRVSAPEIEAAARRVPGVTDVALLVPAENRPATLFAVTTLTGRQVLRGLLGQLEPRRVPDVCHVVAALPRTSHGKVDKARLAAELRGPAGRRTTGGAE
ncbi:class I adenylate-forming enzyme family protein [Streptomyces chartreusis]|uniref:class I adenylate-forming enzyme family protein n=1 Tax=Streptomyces chartreusis TaxID=1969 RepID=UPI0033A96A72